MIERRITRYGHIYRAAMIIALWLTIPLCIAASDGNGRISRRYADFTVCAGDTSVSFVTDTCCSASAFEARVALKGNSHGHWGVRWYDRKGGKYDVRVGRADGDMLMDSPALEMTVTCDDTVRAERKITKGVAPEGGFNTLSVENGEEGVRIYVGAELLSCVLTLDGGVPVERYEFHTEGAVEAEYMVLEEEKPLWSEVITEWNRETMDDYLPSCRGYEGFWDYLDRDMDPAIARQGGKYRLMAVKDVDGDILLLYYDGAETSGRQWRPGMMKGRLRPSPFAGQYELEWYDAHFRRHYDETYATFDEAGRVLTLSFPLLKATMRFAKR